jgi:hypothetical protein
MSVVHCIVLRSLPVLRGFGQDVPSSRRTLLSLLPGLSVE